MRSDSRLDSQRQEMSTLRIDEINVNNDQISLFDTNDDCQESFNSPQSTNKNDKLETIRFNKPVKMMNRHRRIESFINPQPFKLISRKMIINRKGRALNKH